MTSHHINSPTARPSAGMTPEQGKSGSRSDSSSLNRRGVPVQVNHPAPTTGEIDMSPWVFWTAIYGAVVIGAVLGFGLAAFFAVGKAADGDEE